MSDASGPSRRVTVVVAEDQGMIRDAFARLLDLQPDVEVVARAEDGAEAMRLVERLRPDIVLTDIEMPGTSGLDLAEQVASADVPTRVVILTTFARPGYLRRALDAGVAGYVLKAAPVDELVSALRQVASGRRVVAPELAVMAWDAPVELTERERDVLRVVETGVPNREVAATLHLAEGTVRNYLSEAMQKLGARNRAEAAGKARERGLL
ncbi:response regulator transcription factor [Phycicoccus sp. BSK3Z-2]|uniref:Response regulator transcription factor n=1 Tax=Phycicoccus avicenniae TaxID=2828860 RepID=A0A941D640_9MICO|nr:response regulator transcription factor [Phycicoccus avicenniae]MBR7742321.1 response regulator transcription factor [Phycicoccus avicenniae]